MDVIVEEDRLSGVIDNEVAENVVVEERELIAVEVIVVNVELVCVAVVSVVCDLVNEKVALLDE